MSGRRADVAAALFAEMVKRAYLDDAEVWNVAAHVTPGQIVANFGDTAAPYKRRLNDGQEPVD